ncbi:hypothetical protein B0H15DRAFT_584566 [Mycena belliarum]|uniref:Transmembrane protein n=1 Tax=Mycena belliarum TaxID=1033014 RepID=A0AAD6UGU2_9AGAR|nr:hypothetical protein B0H15DRAFT_584566 [Mycena belliae]
MSSPAVSTTTPLDVILGAVVLTGVLGSLFFGAACIQTYNYFQNYRSDGILVKGAVASLWLVDTFHIAVYTYTIWYYIVTAFYTAWIPQVMNWSFKFSVWLSVALVLLLDIFYMVFLTKLAPRYVLPTVVGLTVAAGNIVAVVLGVKIIIFTHFTNIYAISSSVRTSTDSQVSTNTTKAVIYLFFGLFCVKATSIAAAMSYCLYSSNDGFTRSTAGSLSFLRRADHLD